MTVTTDTSRWTLVIQRVTRTTAEIWVGTLFPSMRMPDKARIRVVDASGHTRITLIERSAWKRPFSGVDQRFFVVRRFGEFTPESRYAVYFDRLTDLDGTERWQELRNGAFETLPERLPANGARPFTVALGSCFYEHRDGGSAAEAYKLLYDHATEPARPQVTFMTGDQVYLDIGFDSLSPLTRELKERIADDYARHWRSLGSILTRGGTWSLPDDHEYWNDYPFFDTLIPTLLMLRLNGNVREAWKQAARDGVRNVQRSPVVETFELGGDLSFCLADLRSFRGMHRGKRVMLHPNAFPDLLGWAKGLKSPGVLVISQPLIVEDSSERNLRSFPDQYKALLQALGSTGHDIVVLSGDVHFGRIATASLGPKGGRLIEIISSPLSNLTGPNSISTGTPKFAPTEFPARETTPAGWSRGPVSYDRRYAVDTLPSAFTEGYVQARTKEHFMTVSFSRAPDGQVNLAAQSWLVRARRSSTGLPARGFKNAYTTRLH